MTPRVGDEINTISLTKGKERDKQVRHSEREPHQLSPGSDACGSCHHQTGQSSNFNAN